MFKHTQIWILAMALMAASASSPVRADEDPGLPAFREAKALFAARAESGKAEAAASKALESVAAAADPAVKYDALILASQSYYYWAGHTDDNGQKKERFNLGMAQAKAAQELGKRETALADPAESYFWYGLNLGQWAQANGVVASLGRKNELIGAFRDTLARKSRDGAAGEVYDGYGTYRALGRLYFKLPSFAGGSRARALEFLRKSVAGDGSYVIGWLYLAETLADGNESERTEAKALLNDLVKRDPATMNPERAPENIEEMERARKLLADL